LPFIGHLFQICSLPSLQVCAGFYIWLW
jgi:hypothetical protein